MRIHLVGDLHRETDVGTLETIQFEEGDVILVAGDFGFIWKNPKDKDRVIAKEDERLIDKYFGKLYRCHNVTTLFVDGNHENHNVLAKLPEVELYGGTAGKVTDYCYHLKRGEVYTIAGRKFLAAGGAASIDRWHRIPDLHWWENEVPSYEESQKIIKASDGNIDYVVSHTAPHSACDRLMSLCNMKPFNFHDITEDVLEEVANNFNKRLNRPLLWFFGHWHLDQYFTSNNIDYVALYHDTYTLYLEQEVQNV